TLPLHDALPILLPTHADADHIDGLNDVARNFTVRTAIVARTPPDDPEYSRFAATMKAAGSSIEKIGAGDILHFGNVVAEVLWPRSEEHTSELQSPYDLVCRLLLEKKNLTLPLTQHFVLCVSLQTDLRDLHPEPGTHRSRMPHHPRPLHIRSDENRDVAFRSLAE